MIYPKDMLIKDVAEATNRSPEDIYRLLDALGQKPPVGKQLLEGVFAQTLIETAVPIIDTYGVGYG